MLAMLGKKLEDKMEFVKNEGFKKLLVLGGDKNIRKEIMRTLQLYVDVKIEEDESKTVKENTKDEQNNMKSLNQSEKIEYQEQKNISESNKGNLKGKLKNIAKEFKDILGFNDNQRKAKEDDRIPNPSTDEEVGDRDDNADKDPFDIDFPPNADALKEYLKEFKSSAEEEGGRSSIFELVVENTKELSTNEVERITCNSLFFKRKNKKVIEEDDSILSYEKKPIQRLSDIGARYSQLNRKSTILKEEIKDDAANKNKELDKVEEKKSEELYYQLMRLQGIFSSIWDKLFENNTGSGLQLGLIGILSNLLSNSKNNHVEFMKINGYNILNMFFSTIRDYSTNSGQNFLSSIFELLNKIIFAGSKSTKIQNIEAFGVVLELIGNSRQRLVIEKALDIILEILKKNSFNCVAFYMMNGFLEIDKLIHRLLLSENDLCEWKALEKFKTFVSDNGEFLLKSVKNFTPNEDKSSSLEEEKVSKEFLSSNLQESTKEDNDIDIDDIDLSVLIEEREDQNEIKIEDIEDIQSDNSTNMIECEITNEAKFKLFKTVDSIAIYWNMVLNDLRVFDVPEIYSSFLYKYRNKLQKEEWETMLNTISSLIEDKNYRWTKERYMYRSWPDIANTLYNIFKIYIEEINLSTSNFDQNKLYITLMKLLDHNIIMMNTEIVLGLKIESAASVSRKINSDSNMNVLIRNGHDLLIILIENIIWMKRDSEEDDRKMIQLILLFTHFIKASQETLESNELIKEVTLGLKRNADYKEFCYVVFALLFAKEYNARSQFLKESYFTKPQNIKELINEMLSEDEDKKNVIERFEILQTITLLWENSIRNKESLDWWFDIKTFIKAFQTLNLDQKQQNLMLAWLLELCSEKLEGGNFEFKNYLQNIVEMSGIGNNIPKIIGEIIHIIQANEILSEKYGKTQFIRASGGVEIGDDLDLENVHFDQNNFSSSDDATVVLREWEILNLLILLCLETDEEVAIEFLWTFSEYVRSNGQNSYLLMRLEITDLLLTVVKELPYNNILFQPIINLIFSIFNLGISIEDENLFYSNFYNSSRINTIFLEGWLDALRQFTFPIHFDFHQTSNAFSLSNFLSEKQAQDKIKLDVYEAGRLQIIPSYKIGYTCLFWIKMKKLYEKMSIIKIVDHNNQPLMDIWYSVRRIFDKQNKVDEYIRKESLDNNYQRTSSNAPNIQIDKIEHEVWIKFNYDQEIKFSIDKELGIEINKPVLISIVHNKYLFSLYFNRKEVASIKNPIYPYSNVSKDKPWRIQFQAVDKTLSMVNLFEGVMVQEMIELVYNRGEQDLASYDKEIPEIENSKSIKLLAKFPLNLMLNSNIERQWVKKVSVERDSTVNSATFSISIKTLDYPISLKMKPYKPSYLSSINQFNNQKYKKILVENQYKYPVINVLTLKEFMSNNQTFSLIMSILQGYEENNKSTNIAIQILAHLMIKNQKFMSIFESIKGIELLKPILIEYDANNILKDEMVDLLFQILCNDVEAGKCVDPLTYIKDEFLPIIIPSRIDFLNLILHCIETLSPQNSLKFLEKLVVLIKNERNFKFFRDSLGIEAVFKIFNQEIGANKFIIHEEAITLFELFVEQMEINKDDIIKYFDYLIGAKYIVPLNQRMEHIIVDTLSVFSVHLSIKNSQTFLEKIHTYGLSTTVKAFVVTPHEICEILVIYVFEMIFIAQFIK